MGARAEGRSTGGVPALVLCRCVQAFFDPVDWHRTGQPATVDKHDGGGPADVEFLPQRKNMLQRMLAVCCGCRGRLAVAHELVPGDGAILGTPDVLRLIERILRK